MEILTTLGMLTLIFLLVVGVAITVLFFYPKKWNPFLKHVSFKATTFSYPLKGDFIPSQVKNFYNPTLGNLNIIADNGTQTRNIHIRFSSYVAPERISLEIIGQRLFVKVDDSTGSNVTFKVKKPTSRKSVTAVTVD